ncbi:hypothetical protein ARZXY2_4387 (plasmid) [Arthrobacter sp. ZXY-2]|nr:hypothetical protein ARZXY2_4387 [Arthrobacter sp. ZXY-2]
MRRARGKASRLTRAGFPRTVSPARVFGPRANGRHRLVPVPASPGPGTLALVTGSGPVPKIHATSSNIAAIIV